MPNRYTLAHKVADANLYWQELTVDKAARALHKQQRPVCIWLTGLSGAGKSTIADRVERKLYEQGYHSYVLDGDNVRHGLNRDLGFTDADRTENIRRVAEVARLMVDAGIIVIVSLISPFCADRAFARSLFKQGEFYEVFVDASIETCIQRDPKGVYQKVLSKQIVGFSGIDSPYEVPEKPDLHFRTAEESVDVCEAQLLAFVLQAIQH